MVVAQQRPPCFFKPTATRRLPHDTLFSNSHYRNGRTLFGLAKEIADFADEQTENLNYEDYAALIEYEAKLLAFGNVLSAYNRDKFLEEEIGEAMDCLEHLRQRISPDNSD